MWIFLGSGVVRGFQVALEMVENKTVLSRVHKGLKSYSKIKYPQNLEVKDITEKGSSMTITRKGGDKRRGGSGLGSTNARN